MAKKKIKQKKLPLIDLVLLQHQSLSREEAFSYILANNVFVDGEKNSNPKALVEISKNITILKKQFVSRGGYKLQKALNEFKIDAKGKTVLDAGASTGGFTDCLLQNGAKKVFSVDVGFNQIDYSLRTNEKVVVMEKTNIKEIDVQKIECDFVVADLSFRSIIGVLEKLFSISKEGKIIFLLKPQFEIDAENYPDFNGVIKDKKILLEILETFYKKIEEKNYSILGFTISPIEGASGNKEFLVYLEKSEGNSIFKNCKEFLEFCTKLF